MKNLSNTKISFCPGPGAVIPEWFQNQKQFFGRGDNEYEKIKSKTIKWLKKKSGQDQIIIIPGAATTAAIIALNTFIENEVIVVNTGFYSERWFNYLKKNEKTKNALYIDYNEFLSPKFNKKCKWVIFVYVETASCKIFDIKKRKKKI